MYISFVFGGRNDNYGKGYLERFQNTLDNLEYLCVENNLEAEVICVEWNPPAKNTTLDKALKWPSKIPTRIIRVPKEIHDQVPRTPYDALETHGLNFFEYIAKNTGVRRANGKFVLTSNIDIMFGRKLIRTIAGGLKDNRFYRVDRLEVQVPVPSKLSHKERLDHCKKHYRRVKKPNRSGYVYEKASGDFFLISKDNFERMKGFAEIRCDGLHMDSFGLYTAACFCKQHILDTPIFHQPHEKRWKYYDWDRQCIRGHKKSMKWYKNALSQMRTNKKNLNPNPDSWGLNGIELEEINP